MSLKKSNSELQTLARRSRAMILQMVYNAGCGHFGGPFSMIDMVTALYFYKMNYDVKNPLDPERDQFVLSAGHKCAGLYATLIQAGFVPETEKLKFRKMGSPLQGHPKYKPEWGIDMSTGSLGQGMSVANGMALASRMQKKSNRIYSLESDGGAQEGMFWEGVMTASHYKLDNRCILLDNNNVQIDGFVDSVKKMNPFEDKLRSFGWHVINVDGHDFSQICAALDEAETIKGKPTAIIGKTIMCKDLPSFENKPAYHGKAPSKEEFERAMKELGFEATLN